MACQRLPAERRRGTHAVEFSLVFPVLILFMFAIFEYGRFLMIRQLLDNAAREGARQASAASRFTFDPSTDTSTVGAPTTADIQNKVIDMLAQQGSITNASGQPLSSGDILVYRADPITGAPMKDTKGSDWTQASFGECIAIAITCRYQPMFPGLWFLTNPEPITFICLMRSEANL